jgi:putative ABC transport system ATP-binding protein
MTIELREISKSYQTGQMELQVLRSVTFAIEDGELCAIMGPSGSGKSTLMNIIGCLDSPTTGRYLLDGQDVASLDDNQLAQVRNQKIGFVFQSYNLVKRTTALDNVQLPMLYAGVPPEERRQRAVDALESVGLGDRLDHKPNELSGGQQQRVSIARSLVMRPTLILADEPTGALDSRSSVEVMGIFQELNAELGITVVFVTHEPDIAEYTQRIIRIRDGFLGADERVEHQRNASEELVRRVIVPFPTARAVV